MVRALCGGLIAGLLCSTVVHAQQRREPPAADRKARAEYVLAWPAVRAFAAFAAAAADDPAARQAMTAAVDAVAQGRSDLEAEGKRLEAFPPVGTRLTSAGLGGREALILSEVVSATAIAAQDANTTAPAGSAAAKNLAFWRANRGELEGLFGK
ncbi:MAG: hypothetical protein NW201_14395 [Gemmatimonadales bacterium]|nr:hypothetical protein [Gemmatimonadales bacterium]